MNRPGIPTGALVGALMTAPLIAVLYLAQQLAGLPFVPFDVFDWMARVLPGGVISFGIDTMVSVIRGLRLGPTATAAKAGEQVLAIGGLFVTGVVAGAVLFAVLRRRPAPSGIVPGLIVGAVVGVPVMLISLSGSLTSTVGPVVRALWILAAFLSWGAAMGWACDRLRPDRGAGAAGMAEAEGAADAPERASATGRVGGTPGEPRPELEPIDRRRFLVRLGGASAAITVTGAALGAAVAMRRELAAMRARGVPWSAMNPLPNAGAAVQPVPGTRHELTPVEDHYRIDINTIPPRVDERDWRLRIGGLVGRPRELTLADLRARYEPMHQFITLSCISNPVGGDLIGTTRWTGVSAQRVMADVQPLPSATHLRIRSADDFYEVVALDDVRADPRIMLTYAWDGLPLPAEHGFPLRIYIPDRYGMKQPKWIESIEGVPAFGPGYWVRRGWDREARMRATSVIDVVASNMMVIEPERPAGEPMVVPVGGIAHAGARGISRVEVSVDGGPWQQARLREPLSELTWVLWRFDWAFQPGAHTFTVRCYDGNGTPQVAEPTPVRPAGATGLDSTELML